MRKNRQREMDLNAVGPFLTSLPEEMQRELRLKLAESTFIQAQAAPVPADKSTITMLAADPEFKKTILEIAKSVLVDRLQAK